MQYICGQSLNHVLAELARGRTLEETSAAGHKPAGSEITAALMTRASSSTTDQSYYRNVARIGTQLAEALAYAHGQKILHRDIKPANVLLATDGGVWICDFGLAKFEDDDLTQSGDLVGTFRYMAPERLSGRTDARSDIYSLGLTLYEMLTLRPAFDESDHGRLIRQINESEPIRPTQVDRRVPRDLETIVLKAIAKEPRNRYLSATTLANDLERFLDGRPIQARPASLWERGWKWAKRRPASAAALVVSVLALSAITGMAVNFTLRLKTERDLAEIQRERAEASYNLAREAMNQGLKSVRDDSRLQKGELEDLKRKMVQIETDFYEKFVQLEGDDSGFQVQRADAYYRLGHAAVNFGGTHANAIANFRRAIEVDRNLIASDSRSPRHKKRLADGLYSLGCQLRYSCQLDAALAAHREAEELVEQLRASDPKNPSYQELFAKVLDDHGLCEILLGDFPRAEATVLRAEPVWIALTEQFPQNRTFKWHLTTHWLRLAAAHYGPDALRRKEATFLKALSLAEQLSVEDPNNLEYQLSAARALIELGQKYRQTDRLALSLETLRRADAICEKLVNEHPTTTRFLHDLAYCRRYMAMTHASLKDYDATIECFAKSIELYERLHREHPDVLAIASDLGAVNLDIGAELDEFGKMEAAIPHLDRAIALLEEAHQIDPQSRRHVSRLILAHWERGCARRLLFQNAKARLDYDRAVELSPTGSAPRMYWQRAEIMARLGDHRAAFAELEKTTAGRDWDGNQCVYLARVARECGRAVSADKSLAPSEIDVLAERYAARSVEWLARSKAAGHFDDPARVQELLADPDFEPLRTRDEFRRLFP
jgi:tetratricopeptide (TPR) repeat protein